MDAMPDFTRQRLLRYYLQKLNDPFSLKYLLEATVIQAPAVTVLDLSKNALVSSGSLCLTYTSSHNVFLVHPLGLKLNILISADIPSCAQGGVSELDSLNM